MNTTTALKPIVPRSFARAGLGLGLVACSPSIAATPAPTLSAPPITAAPSRVCISTPGEYVETWNARQTGCVDPRLFATIYGRPGADRSANAQAFLYPDGFALAWAFSSENLELFLELQRDYGDDPTKVFLGMAELAGFGGLETLGLHGDTYNLAIYVLPEGEEARVPSWETWFRLLDGYGLRYPLAAQRELIHRYARLGDSNTQPRHEDIISVFGELSGCERSTMLSSPTPQTSYRGLGYAPMDPSADGAWTDYEGCSQLYQEAIEAAGKSPYDGGTSVQCFERFFANYVGPRRDSGNPTRIAEINAMAIRAALAQCQDASHLNTGAGLGFNSYPNPFVCQGYVDDQPGTGAETEQGVLDRYTGREYIVDNTKLGWLPDWAYIELTATNDKRLYLHEGWCSGSEAG